ncbi:MAG: hypothetical protein IH586_01575, partial [Anaerolineaceae bacterium]|nr:hypothetical protein [Anaerolineaceae bacterium]
MPKPNLLNGLYLLNLALLFTHEIDSAYWQEWKLFGLPGGNQLFLLLNFLLIAVGLYGILPVFRQDRSARFFSLLVAAAGIFAFSIHAYFLVSGHLEFRQPG